MNKFSNLINLGKVAVIYLIIFQLFTQPIVVLARTNGTLQISSGAITKTEDKKTGENDPIIRKTDSDKKPENLFKASDGISKNQVAEVDAKLKQRVILSNKPLEIGAESELKTSEDNSAESGKQDNTGGLYSLLSTLKEYFTNTAYLLPSPTDPTAIVRKGFNLNSAKIEGSVWQLNAESTILNGGGVITGDLLIPGVPSVTLNGNPTFGGVITGTGTATPTSHNVTLNGNSSLRKLYNRINPATMPTVPTPTVSTGTVNLTINNSGQVPASFANVQDITLNGNAGIISVPPGNYRNVIVNGTSKLKLGTAGSPQPVVYNLAQLTLNGSSALQLAGPVIINLSSNFIINGNTGVSNSENWLRVRISAGSFTLNGNSNFYGSVTAPNGTVTINGNSILTGNVACNSLLMNGNSILRLLPISVLPDVSLSIISPVNNFSTAASSISVSGTATGQAGIANVFVNNQPAVYNAANGTWSISNVALSVGNNTLTVRAVDNVGAETTSTITITRTQPPPPDTTVPTLAITNPANGSTTQATSVSVSGTVADTGTNASGVASVTVNGSNASISGGNWNFANVGLNLGSNTITVRATDTAGNFTTQTVTVTRQPANVPDTTPPTLTITSPANNSTTQAETITVSGTVTDTGGTTPSGVANVKVNGVNAVLTGGNWSLANVALTVGANTITVTSADNAGNVSTQTRTVTRENVPDTTAPTITITNPTANFTTQAETININGTVTDTGGTVPSGVANVKVNGVNAVYNSANNSWSFANFALSLGSNMITITATDTAGNIATATITVTRNPVPDTTPPTITITSPANNLTTQAETITVGGTVTDTGGTTPSGIATVKVNGVSSIITGGNWTLANVSLNVGLNNISVLATDNAGNYTTQSISVTRELPPDTVAPALTITTPANNSTTQAETITVSGTVSDTGINASGVASVMVNGNAATRDVIAGTWVLNNFAIALGSTGINVQATDNAGNVSTAQVTVTREPVIPPDTIAPTVIITSPENNINVFSSEISVSGIAKDEGANATGVKTVKVNGHLANYNIANQTWTINNVSLNQGENVIIAEVEDNAVPTSNIGRAEIRVTRQTVLPPTINITSPLNGAVIQSNTVTIAGNASSNAPNNPLTVTVNGQPANLAGNEFTKTVNLNAGSNVITATATDSLNQTSQTSITIISDTSLPTIALQDVPNSVRPSQSYLIKALANDNNNLASVEFLVNGQSAATLQTSPYQFTLQVPSNATPGSIYSISAVAKDFAGNVAVDTKQTIVSGPSGVSGYVFDDKTGYWIADVTASLIDPPSSVITDENGEYNLVSSNSYGTVKIFKSGYTPIERSFETASGTGLSLFDARLTAFDSQANQIGGTGGIASGDNGRIRVSFTSGSLANQTDVRVTSLSPQGLENLLPYGWSPVPGAIIDVRPANSQIQTLSIPAQLEITQISGLQPTTSLTLAVYDEVKHRWIALQTGLTLNQTGGLTASLSIFGQYAFLVADSGETTPPTVVLNKELTASNEASSTALNNAQVTAGANPKTSSVSPNAKSIITVAANSVTKLPSGVSVESSFDETYRLLNERNPITVDRLPQDFVLYSYPFATTAQPNNLGANFVAKPTRTDLTSAQLQFGNVHIGIRAGRTSVEGILIGNQGGEVSSADGATLQIGANSLSQNTSVFLESVDTSLTGISLPEGYEIIGAVDVNLSGATLAQAGKLSIPNVAGDNSRVIAGKIITAGSVRGLKITGRGITENNRIVASVSTNIPAGVLLSGVRTSGRYVFVRVPMPFGYATGSIKNNAGNLVPNTRVSGDKMPFLDLTSANGKYTVLTKAEQGNNGINNIDAVLLNNNATGNIQVTAAIQDSVTNADIIISATALSISAVNPVNNAENTVVSNPISVTFNKPVNPNTVTGSNFKVVTQTGLPVIGNITLLAGNRTAVFTPSNNLAYNTNYQIKLNTSVKDIYGVSLALEFVSNFKTAQLITVNNRLKPEHIRISYPDVSGYSTIRIPGGTLPEGSIITVINNNTGSTVSTVAGLGEIVLQIVAQVGDEIVITVRQPDGTVYEVRQSAYRRADGFVSVGSNGGTITSEDGQIVLAVPQGSIEGQANVKISAAAENTIAIPRIGDMSPSEMPFAGGAKIEVNGAFTQKEELHLEVPAPAGLAEGQRAVFMKPAKITENGVERDIWQIVTTATVANGRIKSTSPPFQGVNFADINVAGNSYTILVYDFIPIRRKTVVGRVTELKTVTVNNVPRTIVAPIKNAVAILPPSQSGSSQLFCQTNAKGEYGLLYTSQINPAKVKVKAVGHPETDVDTIPYQSTSTEWLAALYGFESRYAAVEFSDSSGDPRNRPALIEIQGRTQGFDEANDPLRLLGKVPNNSMVDLKIITTPDVDTANATLRVNGGNTNSLTLTRSSNRNEFTTSVAADSNGTYSVSVKTFTTQNQPLSEANASFNFVAVSDPNNDCGIGTGSSPVILDGWSPRNGATNVDAGTKIKLNFSEKVKNLIPGQTIYLIEDGDPDQIKIGGTISSGVINVLPTTEVCKIEFKPARGLKAGTKYKIYATAGVKDADNQPLSAFSSEFTTFKPLILNNPGEIPTTAYKIASAGDYMATIQLQLPNGQIKLYDVSEPETPVIRDDIFQAHIPTSIDMIEYEQGRGIQAPNQADIQTYDKIVAVTTASTQFQDRANNVWFYAITDNPTTTDQSIKVTRRDPLRLIGVVSLNYLQSSPEFPTSVKILGKRAYVGSATQGGFWAIDIEGAVARLAEDGDEGWFPAVREVGSPIGSGYSTDRVRQKVPNAIKNILMRSPNISGIEQSVDNIVSPIIYPLPLFVGQPAKATAFNLKTVFDNRLTFFDANNNDTDDRVISQTPFSPDYVPIDVKSQSQVQLAGFNVDLSVYLTTSLFWIFNVTNPTSPTQYNAVNFSDFQLTGDARSLQTESHFVYVLFSDKIAVFDILNPEQPYLSSVITGLGNDLTRFTVHNGFIYSLSATTGLRVSTGQPFANILIRGFDEGNPLEICGNPILVKKTDSNTTQMLQDAEVSFKVYGHEVPLSAKVRIRKEKVVDGVNQVTNVKDINITTTVSGANSVIEGKGYWLKTAAGEIDLDASYYSQVILDQGIPSEFVSASQPVPFSTLISNVSKKFTIRYDKGKVNSPDFDKKIIGKLPFLLGNKAFVQLTIDNQLVNPVYPTGDNQGRQLSLEQRKFGFGGYIYSIGKNSFVNSQIMPNGTYPFTLKAIYFGANNQLIEEQTEEGIVEITNSTSKTRQPGSEIVNNVELKSGNLALSYQDLNIPNRGLSLNLTRSYNSSDSGSFGTFGYGWTHNYNIRLQYADEDKTYYLATGDGGQYEFKVPQSGNQNLIKAEKPNQGTLIKNADGSIDVLTKSRTIYHFNSVSKLVYIEEPNKNRLTFAYNTDGNLATVTDSSQRSLVFTYEQAESALVNEFSGEAGAVDCTKRNGFKIARQNFLQGVAGKSWRITKVEAPGGLYFEYNYDTKGNLNFAKKSRTENGNPTLGSLDASADAVWEYGYEQNTATNKSLEHLIKTVQTPNHEATKPHITNYEYDTANLNLPVSKIIFPEIITNTFRYVKENDLRTRTFVEDGNLKETEYIFDSKPESGLEPAETTINAPLGATTVIKWTAFGQKKKETDPEGRTTDFRYDERQNPIYTEVRDGIGNTIYLTSTHYEDRFNKPDQMSVKQSGNVTLTTYYTIDPYNGNVKKVILPNGNTTTMEYFPNGDLLSQIDQFGTLTKFSDYEFGFPKTVKVNTGNGIVQSFREYDGRSRLIGSSGDLEPTVTNTYDTFDRVVNQTILDSSSVTYRDPLTVNTSYKPEGQVASVVKKKNATTLYTAANTFDNLNRLRFVDETGAGINYTQSFSYDKNSNLKTQVNRRGITTFRDYNALNFVTKETVGNKVVMNVSDPINDIDRLGNIKKYTDLFNKTIEQTFDGANRVTARTYSDCITIGGATCTETFKYDGSNNVVEKTDKNGRLTTISYDKLNRMFDVTNPLEYATEYRYNDATHTSSVTDVVRGVTETVIQDGLNRPTEQKTTFGQTTYKTNFSYDGLTKTITDPRGTVTEQKLSAFGDVGEVKVSRRPNGVLDQEITTSAKYFALGGMRESTDANDRKTTYTLDGLSRVTAAVYQAPTHLSSVTESWVYDGEDLLVNQTDKRGVTMAKSYDALGRETSVKVGAIDVVKNINYLDSSATEEHIDANNHKTTMVYDGLHRVKTLINADDNPKTYKYDGENLLSETDFNNKPTVYEYDKLDRVKKVTDRTGNHYTDFEYTDGGFSTKQINDRRGNFTTEKYDALGRLIEVEHTSQSATQGGTPSVEIIAKYDYDANNNKINVLDGKDNESKFVYNNLNRVVNATSGTNAAIPKLETYAYDNVGNVLTQTDGRGGGITRTYDALNHLLTSNNGFGDITKFEHDGEGLLAKKEEPKSASHVTTYAYNAVGSVANVTQAGTGSWSFNYKADGKLLEQVTSPVTTDGRIRNVSYTYDKLDRIDTVTQPLGIFSKYEYDKNSNVTSIKDGKGQLQDMTYDMLDNLDTHSYKDSVGTVKLAYQFSEYTAEEEVQKITETYNAYAQAGVYQRSYDGRGRLTSSTDKYNHKVEFDYDAVSNIKAIKDYKTVGGNPTATNYEYDAQNRLAKVKEGANQIATYSYEVDGLLKDVNYVAGMKREYGYDAADRVANITNTINQTDKQRFDYEYDENSNRKKETQSLQGTPRKVLNFTHDLADRLTQTKETTPAPNTQPAPSQTINVTETSSLKGHSYDAVGNRLTESTQTETVGIQRVANAQGTVTETRGTPQLSGVQNATAKFDELNRLYELTEPSGVSNLTYDNNGNLQTVSKNGTTQQQFEYDPRDQLRKVKDSVNTEIASFDYDSERRRVSKIVNGASVYPEHYVYAGDKIVAEYTGITDYEITKAKYSLGANEVIKANFTRSNEGEKYYFTDALGSTTALASANATATQKYDYDSWGKSSVVQNLPSTSNSIGYTGQRLDNETGLMALGNGERYYSPTLARFIQQDSFTGSLTNGQSLNRFAYALNNPLKFIDPSGNEGLVAEKIQTTLLKNGSNTGNETVDWWLNFGASFNAGFTYDAFNFMTAGLAGAADVMAKDAMNGKTTSFGDAWMRNGYSASTSQIAANFLYYGAGVGQGIKNVAKSLPAIGYGLLTNPRQTLGMMGSGIKESLSNGAYYAFNPRAGLDELAQNSQEEIAFGVGETVGEAVAAEGVGAVAGKIFGVVGKALGRTRIGSAVAKVFTEAGSKFGAVRQGIQSFESKALGSIERSGKNILRDLDFSSGRTIHGKKASASMIEQFGKEFEEHGISINRKADRILDKYSNQNSYKAAGFNYKSKEILLRKGATEYELLHEVEHARHFIELGGREGYEAVGQLAREERVFEKLMESKHLFNSYEVRNMQSVIDTYRRQLSGGR